MKEETLTLESFAYGGDTFGRSSEGRATFVPFALPNEKVRIRLLEENRGFARGELLEVLEPSPHTSTSLCTFWRMWWLPLSANSLRDATASQG